VVIPQNVKKVKITALYCTSTQGSVPNWVLREECMQYLGKSYPTKFSVKEMLSVYWGYSKGKVLITESKSLQSSDITDMCIFISFFQETSGCLLPKHREKKTICFYILKSSPPLPLPPANS
jgi:hypothetical protein